MLNNERTKTRGVLVIQARPVLSLFISPQALHTFLTANFCIVPARLRMSAFYALSFLSLGAYFMHSYSRYAR